MLPPASLQAPSSPSHSCVLGAGVLPTCRVEIKEEYKCMCQEFRDQIADPDFEGYCHCMLYYKSLED